MISFVVPVFNGERFLRECIDSIVAQQDVDSEIVVVDDGSTDSSPEIAQSYGEALRLMRTRNRGVSMARNLGFAHTSGEFVVFIDQDDTLIPTYGVRMAQALRDAPLAGAVYCDTVVKATDSDDWVISEGDFTDRMYVGLLQGKCFVSPGAVMLRRSAFEAVGGFDPVLSNKGEDLDLWLDLALLFPWVYVPEPLFCWRKHGANQSDKLMTMYRGVKHILERHMKLNRPEWLSETDVAKAFSHSRKGIAAHLRRGLKHELRGGGNKAEAIKRVLRDLRQAPELIPYFFKP